MKVSESWLRSFVNPPQNIQELALQMTQNGLEVDSVEEEPGSSGKKEWVLTLKVAANRGDFLSMEGVARFVAALHHLPYQRISFKTVIPQISKVFQVSIKAGAACPRYCGRIIQNLIEEHKTPSWMKERLELAGIRSVSPVVDVTNYVMLELGQPLHAFDLEKLDKELIIRLAKKNEKMTLLDGTELSLTEDDLVIADATNPVALAGVMGGASSSVTNSTRTIFLESAYFDPIHIRTTAKRHGLRTDSSIRFERGVDPGLQIRALERATQLLNDIASGNVSPIIEICDEVTLPKNKKILLRSSRIKQILGISLSRHEIQHLLKFSEIELEPEQNKEGEFRISVPSFRVDLLQEEDIIEEIACLYGYEKIPSHLPTSTLEIPTPIQGKIPLERIRQCLISRGYYEAITYSFISKEKAELFAPNEKSLELSNPISNEMAVMRTSLLPGLFSAALYNQDRQLDRIRLFEVGRIFLEKEGQHQEKNILGGVCLGSLYKEQWGIKQQEADFFDIKGDLESLLSMELHSLPFSFKESHLEVLQPGKGADIFCGGIFVGFIGVIHPKILKTLDLRSNAVAFELDLDKISETKTPQFQEISKYPAIRRDIALIVSKEISSAMLKESVIKRAGPLLKEVSIFDVYEGKGIASGSKSVALGLLLQHPSRTLVESEVTEVVEGILKTLKDQFSAVLRE